MTVFDQKSGKINKIEQISRLGRFPPISIEFVNLANFWSDMRQKHVRVGKNSKYMQYGLLEMCFGVILDMF